MLCSVRSGYRIRGRCMDSVLLKLTSCRWTHSGKTTVDLSGIFPPITTPFNADESIAWDKLEGNLREWQKIPFKGLVVQGSNGEYPLMKPQERVEMVKRVKGQMTPDKLLIAGSACESTRDTVELTNRMAEVGADAVMIVTPSYYKSSMTGPALVKHFVAVADRSSIPVILYNIPSNTGVDLSPQVIRELAGHPNIVGIKDSGGDITKMARVVHDTKNLGFQVVAGSTGFLLPALLVGCVGGINGLANILGEEVCRIYQLFKTSKLEEAVQLHLKLVTPNALVTRDLGVPAMKAAMDMVGLYGGPCRRPLLPLSSAEADRVRTAFKEAGYAKKRH